MRVYMAAVLYKISKFYLNTSLYQFITLKLNKKDRNIEYSDIAKQCTMAPVPRFPSKAAVGAVGGYIKRRTLDIRILLHHLHFHD